MNAVFKVGSLFSALLLVVMCGCNPSEPSTPAGTSLWGDKAAEVLRERIVERLVGQGFTVVDTSDSSTKLKGTFGESSEPIRLQLLQTSEGHDPGTCHSFTIIPMYPAGAYSKGQIVELNSMLQGILDTEKNDLTIPHDPYDNQ